MIGFTLGLFLRPPHTLSSGGGGGGTNFIATFISSGQF